MIRSDYKRLINDKLMQTGECIDGDGEMERLKVDRGRGCTETEETVRGTSP